MNRVDEMLNGFSLPTLFHTAAKWVPVDLRLGNSRGRRWLKCTVEGVTYTYLLKLDPMIDTFYQDKALEACEVAIIEGVAMLVWMSGAREACPDAA